MDNLLGIAILYFRETIPYLIVTLTLHIVIRVYCVKKKRIKPIIMRELILLCLVVLSTIIVKLTIIPNWEIYYDSATQKNVFFNGLSSKKPINLIPLKNIMNFTNGSVSVNPDEIFAFVVLNLCGTFSLFLGLGLLLPEVHFRFKRLHNILFVSFATTIIIEFIQYYIGRIADIDDVIINSCGMIVGYFINLITHKTIKIVRKN